MTDKSHIILDWKTYMAQPESTFNSTEGLPDFVLIEVYFNILQGYTDAITFLDDLKDFYFDNPALCIKLTNLTNQIEAKQEVVRNEYTSKLDINTVQ